MGGCVGFPGPDREFGSPADTHEESQNNQQEAEQTRDAPSATPPSNEKKREIELPGTPKTIRNGRLPVYRAAKVVNARSEQFADGLGGGQQSVTVGSRGTEMSFAPEHEGTGRASGYATGTYQTAWTAPETGKYQLKATFHRSGGFYYDLPRKGDVMTSLDINAQVVNYDTSRVVANQRFPQSLRSSNQRSSNALAEFLVETAVTVLLGYSLGLSLIARVVLSQIVDQLIELQSPGAPGSEYDIATTIKRQSNPLNIGGPFNVPKDTTVIFEISPMLSWSYGLADARMNPRFNGNFDLEGFWVQKLD